MGHAGTDGLRSRARLGPGVGHATRVTGPVRARTSMPHQAVAGSLAKKNLPAGPCNLWFTRRSDQAWYYAVNHVLLNLYI